MKKIIKLGVYRRLDNRLLGLSDESEMALQFHKKREFALLDVFNNDQPLIVSDWGETKDNRPHEFVEILLGISGSLVFNYAIVPGLKFVGELLIKNVLDETITESAKWIISKLRPKQENKEILDFIINLPDGTSISVHPPDTNASISIHFHGGNVETIKYNTITD